MPNTNGTIELFFIGIPAILQLLQIMKKIRSLLAHVDIHRFNCFSSDSRSLIPFRCIVIAEDSILLEVRQ